jgi:hypothetical protein
MSEEEAIPMAMDLLAAANSAAGEPAVADKVPALQ